MPPAKSSVNPLSIELALLCLMSQSSGSEENESRLSAFESTIKLHHAQNSLETLLRERCERQLLLRSLGLACGNPADFLFDDWFTEPGPESIERLFGLDSGRKFKALRARLLKTAEDVEETNRRFEFGVLLTTSHLQLFQGLPGLVRAYVSLLDLAADKLGRGTKYYRNLGTAILTLYVKQQTGQFHDEHISALVAAIRDNKYGPDSQQTWRKDHSKLLADLQPLLPIFTSESVGRVLGVQD